MLKRVLRLRDLSLCKLSRHSTRKFLFWVWKKFWKERTVRRFRLGTTALPVAGTTCFYLKEEEWSGVNRTSYACCKLYFFSPQLSLLRPLAGCSLPAATTYARTREIRNQLRTIFWFDSNHTVSFSYQFSIHFMQEPTFNFINRSQWGWLCFSPQFSFSFLLA